MSASQPRPPQMQTSGSPFTPGGGFMPPLPPGTPGAANQNVPGMQGAGARSPFGSPYPGATITNLPPPGMFNQQAGSVFGPQGNPFPMPPPTLPNRLVGNTGEPPPALPTILGGATGEDRNRNLDPWRAQFIRGGVSEADLTNYLNTGAASPTMTDLSGQITRQAERSNRMQPMLDSLTRAGISAGEITRYINTGQASPAMANVLNQISFQQMNAGGPALDPRLLTPIGQTEQMFLNLQNQGAGAFRTQPSPAEGIMFQHLLGNTPGNAMQQAIASGQGPGDQFAQMLASGYIPSSLRAQFEQQQARNQAMLADANQGSRFGSDYTGASAREYMRGFNDLAAETTRRALDAYGAIGNRTRGAFETLGNQAYNFGGFLTNADQQRQNNALQTWLRVSASNLGSEQARNQLGFGMLMDEFERANGLDPNLQVLARVAGIDPGVIQAGGGGFSAAGAGVAAGGNILSQLLGGLGGGLGGGAGGGFIPTGGGSDTIPTVLPPGY